jgi:hypothetical protein
MATGRLTPLRGRTVLGAQEPPPGGPLRFGFSQLISIVTAISSELAYTNIGGS